MNYSDQPHDPGGIEERYLAIKERVWRAAEACGREPAAVKLVAVTKNFEAADILPVLRQGHRISARTACRRPCTNGRPCASSSRAWSCI